MNLTVRIPVGLLLIGALTSCESYRQYQRRAELEEVEKAVAQRVKTFGLATFSHGLEAGPTARVRVVVGPDHTSVDNAAWLQGLSDEALQEAHRKVTEGPRVWLEKGIDAAAVAQALQSAAQREVAVAGGLSGNLELLVAGEVPAARLDEVLQAAAKAGYHTYGIGGDTKEGVRYLTLEAPQGCAEVELSRAGGKAVAGYCAVPELAPTPQGWMVRARSLPARGPACEGSGSGEKAAARPRETDDGAKRPQAAPAGDSAAQGEPELLPWDGRVMLAEGKTCPPVGLVEGQPDLKRLTRLMREISAIAPVCTSSRLRAAPDTPWQALVPVALTLTQHTDLSRAALVVEPAVALDCRDGLRPGELPEVTKALAQNIKAVNRLSIMGKLDELTEDDEE